MATIQAVGTVSAAVVALLERALLRENQQLRVALTTTNELRAGSKDEAVTLTLYRISPNQTLRNPPPSSDPMRRRPPLPVDLHFVLTAFAGSAARQQLLLAWAMRTLEDSPVLSAQTLNRASKEAPVFRERLWIARQHAAGVEVDPVRLRLCER